MKAEYQLPRSRYPADFAAWPDFREQHAFVAAILARAEALPGVAAAAIAGNHPLDPGFTQLLRHRRPGERGAASLAGRS